MPQLKALTKAIEQKCERTQSDWEIAWQSREARAKEQNKVPPPLSPPCRSHSRTQVFPQAEKAYEQAKLKAGELRRKALQRKAWLCTKRA